MAKKATSEPAVLKAPAQIAILKRLHHEALAWLLGMSKSTVRDKPEIEPNSDGTYNAQAAVKAVSVDGEAEKIRRELDKEKAQETVEKLRGENLRREIENKRLMGEVVSVEHITEVHITAAKYIREAGERMGRKSTLTGKNAQQILNDALAKFERELAKAKTT